MSEWSVTIEDVRHEFHETLDWILATARGALAKARGDS